MSIDTFTISATTSNKDARRFDYQRGDRVQDHGVASNTYERKDPFNQERALQRKRKLADRALDDELAALSPSQLEKEADKILAEADSENAMIKEYNDIMSDRATVGPIDEDDAELKEKRLSPSGRNFTVVDVRDEGNYTDEFGLAEEMSLRRKMRGRRGSTSSPDFTFEGSHGDDEDLADTATPVGGYQIR